MNPSLDEFINNGFLNLDLIEDQYARYQKDPASVDSAWRPLFDQFSSPLQQPQIPPPISESLSHPTLTPQQVAGKSVIYYPRLEIASSGPDMRVQRLVDAYRTYGHLAAKINPIFPSENSDPPQLALENFGFSRQDLPSHVSSCGLFPEESVPLLDVINALKSTYCDRIGVEYMRIHSPEMEQWLQDQVEHKRFRQELSIEQKQMILQQLNKSEIFESFIHMKFVGQKRFSLEGGETLIPMLASLIDTGASLGIDEYILGMAHRGRLNVLANIFDKSYSDIFSEFEDNYIPASVEGSGDVKYHKGFYSDLKTVHGHSVQLTLTPNPSHLEAIDPVVEGQVRGRQTLRNDDVAYDKVLPVLIHGDAAFAGQGVVYETLQLSQLEGYATGGTVHIIVNNQIGFTTLPKYGRSTCYATDLAKVFGCPVFHVNAEDPEGCVFATNLAVQLRQKFHCDIFIDLVCYRKYGHNETDEPAFTQPQEYQIIRKKQPIRDIYRDELIHQGLLESSVAEALEAEFKSSLQEALKEKKLPSPRTGQENTRSAIAKNDDFFRHIQTGVTVQTLQEVGFRLCHVPEGFVLHPKLAVLNKERESMLKEDNATRFVDWGMAELLAYGTILWDGTSIRLSGQDTCRGTFSHRHALFMDQVKVQEYIPLQHLKGDQGHFDVYNSPLSEYAVVGFEFGYSLGVPEGLTIWEAQFGDFANGAQIVIDQFISTAEQKWCQKSGLTLLLPHGFEGQGPEHSSARIERFLTLAGDHNMQIVNPTTPAQLFHLLRRQVLRPIKKPLIIFTPKGLLRHPSCVSRLSDFTQGSFQEILDDPSPPKRTRRLVLCSGRIYYDIAAERDKMAVDDISIVRIEQLYPFDIDRLKSVISRCQGLKECIWAQEEPSNMGAWNFIRPILREILPKDIDLTYAGRTRSASPAVGSYSLHKKEHDAILDALFGPKDPSIFDIAGHQKA